MEEVFTDKKKKKFTKWLLIIIIIFGIIALVFGVNTSINTIYQDKFLPGTSLGGIEIAGLTVEDARSKLEKRIDFMNRRGFVYKSSSKTVTVSPIVPALQTANSLNLIVAWDIDQSLKQVMDFQNNKDLNNLFPKLLTLINGKDFILDYEWNKEQHLEILETSFKNALSDKQEAKFEFLENNELKISAEQIGQTFNYQEALNTTQRQIETLISTDISLNIIKDQPDITANIIEEFRDSIINIVNRGDFNFIYDTQDWNIPNSIWRQWLVIKKSTEENFYIGFDQVGLESYLLSSEIKETLETEVRDAKFELEEGRVTEFISEQEGRAINIEQLVKDLEDIIQQSGELELELQIKISYPKVNNKDVNDLGIVEIIGTGESNFRGSPANRVHNIKVGAAALHGILIKPGEEFSLMTALGRIDAENGYLEELVIKGGKTIPEFGGGLCQIGTTMFRAALASGLPITERRNHSYRVSYYEPAGTDATIYDPWPDFKFKNNTGKYILIQARIEGSKIYFDFWGTKDGREVILTEPEIYNIVAPPEKKVIKTTEIPVGTEKCTESAHAGADAKFDYSVQYTDQPEPVEITFYSHYVPWQEVCLLGVTAEELLAEQEVP